MKHFLLLLLLVLLVLDEGRITPVSSSSPQVPLLRHRGEGVLSVLWRDVLQEGSGVGERDGEERGHQADSGVFTALQTGDAPARVSKCQRPKFARQPARREGKQEF